MQCLQRQLDSQIMHMDLIRSHKFEPFVPIISLTYVVCTEYYTHIDRLSTTSHSRSGLLLAIYTVGISMYTLPR